MISKKIHSIYLTFAIIVVIGISNITAQTYDKPGTASVAFLKLGVTAKGESMGQAIVASVDDASATFYNPAGLMNIKGSDIILGYTSMPADVNLSYLSAAKRLSDSDVIAVSAFGMNSGEMIERTILNPEGTGRTFGYLDYSFGVSYAHNFTMDLSIGFNVNYLMLNPMSNEFSTHSWSANMGLQYNTNLTGILEGLKIGMMVSNFGPEIMTINESYSLPLKYTVGISKPVNLSREHNILIAANWVKAIDEEEKTQLGMEYNFQNKFFLRGGYKFASELQTWSGGAGFYQSVSDLVLRIDYCYSDFGDLEALHRISIGASF